ncbi:MAG: FHA domain-containing protein [Anaerolineae bacterium]|nr:FHA domain-containing protein [Chloroflexota bacterium]MBP6298690.1 FHA domain-containing protein [Anaerolineae bacterium]
MSDQKRSVPVLVVMDGPEANKSFAIENDEVIIGREETCDIVLRERQISREHIRIYRADGRYYVEDKNSRNGTWVNGKKLENETRELYDNDEIHIALAVRLQFIGSGATAPLPYEVPQSLSGRLRLDREARRVYIHDTELDPPLSLPQYRLLELLYLHAGRVCTRETVVETVWPDVVGEGVSEQAIDALVRRLRDRLAELDPEHQYIVTMRGHGFRLDNPPE